MKLFSGLIMALVAFTGVAKADSFLFTDLQHSIASEVHINNAINWKVGEYTEYDLAMSMFGNIGKLTKKATSEQGNAVWLKSEVTGMQSQTVEALIDRANGQILEYRENGQKKEIPKDKLEIISQDSASVTVPAGTFETIHIVAKSEKAKKIEVWMNPRDITLDGAAQTIIESQFGPISMKLTKFGGR